MTDRLRMALSNAAGMVVSTAPRRRRPLDPIEREHTLRHLLNVHPKPLICPTCGRHADYPAHKYVPFGFFGVCPECGSGGLPPPRYFPIPPFGS